MSFIPNMETIQSQIGGEGFVRSTMPTLGKYSKAYPLKLFRQFPEWREKLKNSRKIRKEINGEIVEVERDLTDSDYLYLQENFTVTDSIFLDENIIFSDVTPAWIDFCRNVLCRSFPTDEHEYSPDEPRES
jgi:hypothetical protein